MNINEWSAWTCSKHVSIFPYHDIDDDDDDDDDLIGLFYGAV